LASVSDGGGNSAAYSYLANSSLVGQITFAHSGTTEMTTSKQYDYLNRLSSISSPSNSFAYQYNAANQRTQSVLDDGSYWQYQYDALGQLFSGNKNWLDGTPVAGQQFGYTFDTIGNRTQTQAGGDQNGANLRVANYTNNSLNQITSRSVPSALDVMGLAPAGNGVTVNSSTAYRKGEYFREQLNVTNTSVAVWDTVTVAATGLTGATGHAYMPRTPESNSYDADGDLLSDGRWNYSWDGENRLVGLTSLSGAPSGSQLQLAFAYDYQGRRIQKIVSTNNGTNYASEYTNAFAYDGWNLTGVFDGSGNQLYSFNWGTDLSGSMHGAGGVGGLISMTVYSGTNAGTYFYTYDGNGNVGTLVNVANGAAVANYEYGPFGEVIRATGPMAKVNPFLFQTDFYDWETGKYYVKYRYYDSTTGRFLNRDPEEEDGGLNLYGFVANNPINLFDVDGCGWAVEAYDYWSDKAGSGEANGGVWGTLEATASVATMVLIDFSGALGVDQSSGKAGTAAGQGQTCKSTLYIVAVTGEIVASAVPGAGKGAGAIEDQALKALESKAETIAEKGSAEVATKLVNDIPKLLNQFNSVGSLLGSAGTTTRLKNGVIQAVIKGDGNAIYQALVREGKVRPGGAVELVDGTILTKHISKKTGQFTLDINVPGQIYKVRIDP
jgi:RHS repeat-associated protein